jgi:hypothetical protein
MVAGDSSGRERKQAGTVYAQGQEELRGRHRPQEAVGHGASSVRSMTIVTTHTIVAVMRQIPI